MVATLVPWDCTPARGWAYMDDRGLAAAGPGAPEVLERGLAITKQFDHSIGYTENVGKRQIWVKGQGDEIEHFGLACDPGNPSVPIRPRGGWSKTTSRWTNYPKLFWYK
eukprot:9169613-Pyramimonas_sp.AAC.1